MSYTPRFAGLLSQCSIDIIMSEPPLNPEEYPGTQEHEDEHESLLRDRVRGGDSIEGKGGRG